MNRPRSRPKPRLTRAGERLVSLALGLASSSSLSEDRYWESLLERELGEQLDANHDSVVEAALEHLSNTNQAAYEELLNLTEGLAESLTLSHEGTSWNALAIAAPIIASSKYGIPAGAMEAAEGQALGALIQKQALADEARLSFAAHLFSIEHLPKKFSQMRALVRQMAEAALKGVAPAINLSRMPETPHMLADVRFVVAVVVAPQGKAYFRWQELGERTRPGRAQILDQWTNDAAAILGAVLRGCQFECLLPDAYFASAREADRRVRPVALRAGVSFLTAALQVTPMELRAVIAGFGEKQLDEYRIGFTRKDDNEVLHGVVWPLFLDETNGATPGPIDDIETCLRANGVTKIDRISEPFAPEFCSDCGAPLFADPAGDIVHAELPEDAEVSNNYLH
jgi:hypothetical protein